MMSYLDYQCSKGKSITIVNDKVRNLDIEIGTDQSLYNLTKEAVM